MAGEKYYLQKELEIEKMNMKIEEQAKTEMRVQQREKYYEQIETEKRRLEEERLDKEN